MCRFYDVSKAYQCAEPVAEPVAEKQRTNFCGYFEPAAGRFEPADPAANASLATLKALSWPQK